MIPKPGKPPAMFKPWELDRPFSHDHCPPSEGHCPATQKSHDGNPVRNLGLWLPKVEIYVLHELQ